REELDQERCDRPVDHGDVERHDDQEQLGHHPVDLRQVGLGRVPGVLQGRPELRLIPPLDRDVANPGDDVLAVLGRQRGGRSPALARKSLARSQAVCRDQGPRKMWKLQSLAATEIWVVCWYRSSAGLM